MQEKKNTLRVPRYEPAPVKKSFRKGWEQVPVGLQSEMRELILKIFGITSRSNFSPKVNGRLGAPTHTQGEQLEAAFHAIGIDDIWD